MRAYHSKVFFHLEDFGSSVEVVDGPHPDTSSDDVKAGVLNYLKLVYQYLTGVQKPDRSFQSEKRTYQGFEGCQYSLLLLTSVERKIKGDS